MSAVTSESQKPPAHAAIFQLLSGISIAGTLSSLAQLGIPDLVEHGPKSADELAREIGADPRALYRLMRATASVGILSEDADGCERTEKQFRELFAASGWQLSRVIPTAVPECVVEGIPA